MKIIAICGGSASGKSTLIAMLKEQFGNRIAVLDMDNYYISHDHLSYEGRREINYDLPESLDKERILFDVKTLQEGEMIEQPLFSFTTYQREKEVFPTNPAEFLIVDGIFSLYFHELRDYYDLKVYIDVDSETRFARRILRNQELYKRPLAFEVEQYFDKVKPMHEKYVEPCKRYADLIVPFYEDKEEKAAFLAKIIEGIK